jgi:hypothetical protein
MTSSVRGIYSARASKTCSICLFGGAAEVGCPGGSAFQKELSRPSQHVSKTILRRLVLRFVWPPEASVFLPPSKGGHGPGSVACWASQSSAAASRVRFHCFASLPCAARRLASVRLTLPCFALPRFALRRALSRLASPCFVVPTGTWRSSSTSPSTSLPAPRRVRYTVPRPSTIREVHAFLQYTL